MWLLLIVISVYGMLGWYVDIKNGGRVVVLNTKNLPLVGEVGLGADLVRLDGKAMCSPGFSCDSAFQVIFFIYVNC